MLALPLYLRGHRSEADLLTFTLICFAGGASGVFIARLLVNWFFANKGTAKKFAATLLLLSACSVAVTAFLFSLQFQIYFSQWHEPVFTKTRLVQFAFTGGYSVYLFASSALHQLAAPLNVVILFICSWIFTPQR